MLTPSLGMRHPRYGFSSSAGRRGTTEILPISIRQHRLTGDATARFALNVDAELSVQALPHGNRLTQVTDRSATTLRKSRLFSHGQAIQVFQKESHGRDYTRR